MGPDATIANERHRIVPCGERQVGDDTRDLAFRPTGEAHTPEFVCDVIDTMRRLAQSGDLIGLLDHP